MKDCKAIAELDERITRLEQIVAPIVGKIYTQREAAGYLGISVPTLRAYRHNGWIKPLQGTTRFTQDELDRFKEKHSTQKF